MRVEAKICGLVRAEDARVAVAAGADYLGVIFAPGPRRRDPEQAAEIWAGLERRRVGVFVDSPLDAVSELAGALDLAVVQLHGSEDTSFCREIREAGPWSVWKALRMAEGLPLAEAIDRYADVVDGILVEGHSTAGHGGVGAIFDWSRLDDAREIWPKGLKLILAGGLTSENVVAAIQTVRPHVVDVSSGVESEPGRKDPKAVKAFIDAVRGNSG